MALPTDELLEMTRICGVNRLILYASFLSMHIRVAKTDPDVLKVLQSFRQILHTGVALNLQDEEWAYNNFLRIMVRQQFLLSNHR